MKLLRTLGQAIAVLCLSSSVGVASVPPIKVAAPATETIAPAVQRTGWVTDAADIIPDDVEQRLAAKLDALERRTQLEMVIVTVPTLAGRDVADVADELGSAWHVGRAGHDDGVVLLVAPADRRMRISTSNGMWRLLTDEACRQIIDETMLPHFRQGDLAGGIEAGADAIIAQIG